MNDSDEWEKALAYAPSVSYDYWKSIALRYADYLVEQDDMQAANYYQLSGEISKVTNYIIYIKNFDKIYLIFKNMKY